MVGGEWFVSRLNKLCAARALRLITLVTNRSQEPLRLLHLKDMMRIDMRKEEKLFNSLTPKISLVILLTVCHTVFVMLGWRIWY